ncbi:MAG: zinc ribbon domain-containing protein [Spirochaetales bacterium]|nr:zinc ribbon domain-containing protein [Spirochaetales bacterium]
MPLYDYKCTSCNKQFEKMQSFSEDPIKDCPYCKGKNTVHKMISEPAVVFKGKGFYCTDNHKCSCGDNCQHK